MKVLKTLAELKTYRNSLTKDQKISFVPTMGALHEGHLSLVTLAKQKADLVIASIYVNPLQFGPGEDLEKYPRPFDSDSKKLENAGVSAIFAPSANELTPPGLTIVVDEPGITQPMCGMFRPGHFKGVATIVLKLFHLVRPDFAVFGEKDFQQLRLIEKIVKDLDLETSIVRAPIFREVDGLAMSSRNQYLSSEQRKSAPALYRALSETRLKIIHEKMPFDIAINEGRQMIESHVGLHFQYFEAREEKELKSVHELNRSQQMRLFVAATLGTTRLIDNLVI